MGVYLVAQRQTLLLDILPAMGTGADALGAGGAEGQKHPVSDIELNALAEVLGVSVNWLLGRDN